MLRNTETKTKIPPLIKRANAIFHRTFSNPTKKLSDANLPLPFRLYQVNNVHSLLKTLTNELFNYDRYNRTFSNNIESKNNL